MQFVQKRLAIEIEALRRFVTSYWNNTIKGRAISEGSTESRALEDLYQAWLSSPYEDRPRLENSIVVSVTKYADSVISSTLSEKNPDLRQNIVSAVLRGLPVFRRECKFSTWVYSIIKNHINMELRRRTRERRILDSHVDVSTIPTENDEGPWNKWSYSHNLEERIHIDRIRASLSVHDNMLLDGKCENATNAEIGQRLRISKDAVDSRWRRLKLRLKEKLTTCDGS